jgi:CheY-like chemotaxis protein
MRGVLEAGGFEVRLAADGVEALERLAKEPMDLVVTDIMMPRMDGLALTRQLRAEPRFRRLPIVVVTSLDKEEERRQGLEAGADAYITKAAFDQGHLLTVIEGLLRRGNTIDARA